MSNPTSIPGMYLVSIPSISLPFPFRCNTFILAIVITVGKSFQCGLGHSQPVVCPVLSFTVPVHPFRGSPLRISCLKLKDRLYPLATKKPHHRITLVLGFKPPANGISLNRRVF